MSNRITEKDLQSALTLLVGEFRRAGMTDEDENGQFTREVGQPSGVAWSLHRRYVEGGAVSVDRFFTGRRDAHDQMLSMVWALAEARRARED